jgi:hypothetical protein
VGGILWLDGDRAGNCGELYDMLAWWDELRDLFTLPTLYRVVTAAYLYQFEYLVRHHLMAVGSENQSE